MGLCCCIWAFSSCGKQGLLSSYGAWTSHCGGFSCFKAQALGYAGSVAVVHGLSCPMVHRIFLDQGSNPCPLHWQVDSLSLDNQGSPLGLFLCPCYRSDIKAQESEVSDPSSSSLVETRLEPNPLTPLEGGNLVFRLWLTASELTPCLLVSPASRSLTHN